MELDGDFAEALELLDEAIDEFPDRLQETFDEIMNDWNVRWTDAQKSILGDDYATKGNYK